VRFVLLFLLVCLAISRIAEAVVPPPDGGYPGFNTAEGTNSLHSLTTGVGNAAVGWYSLFSNTDGSFNTAVGAATLLLNVGNQNTGEGTQNTAIGTAALLFNSTGQQNTATGGFALEANSIGSVNSAFGFGALQNNTEASDNTAMGAFALTANTMGNFNTASGASALQANTIGLFNTACGFGALSGNTNGSGNTALGKYAGFSTTGDANVCVGADVLGVGGESSTTRIRNIGSTPILGGTTVVVESLGGFGDARLGYTSSSRRYKQEINPMENASERLFALKPVTFRAKGDTDGFARVKHYGLIAEQVATVDPDLVVFNPEGKPETLRFDSINAMLLNEFLKEHKRVEEQEATITQLKKDFGATIAQLTSRLDEQAFQIQKVSAQIAAASPSDGGFQENEFAPQAVNNQ